MTSIVIGSGPRGLSRRDFVAAQKQAQRSPAVDEWKKHRRQLCVRRNLLERRMHPPRKALLESSELYQRAKERVSRSMASKIGSLTLGPVAAMHAENAGHPVVKTI